jgi:hypothetical protein
MTQRGATKNVKIITNDMQTIKELSLGLKLSPEQQKVVENYFNSLVVELLESLKQDNIKNFDETISQLKA